MSHPIRRVLIYRLGSLGDTIVALPAFHLVARAFPSAERRLLTNVPAVGKAAPVAAVLGDSGLIDSCISYPLSTRNPLELLALWWKILMWRPQVVVHLGSVRGVRAARRDALFFRLCGVIRQVGAAVTEDMQSNRYQEQYQALEPEYERLTRNIRELGDAHCDLQAAWDLRLNAAERETADQVLEPASERPLLAVSVGTKMQSKDWGKQNWRALLERLGSAFPEYALVLIGVKDENEASSFAAEGWRVGAAARACVVNLCGLLTPRESAAVLARARTFLGHDSGPMHLAAAVGTPCVAIFAARNRPRIWFPHGDQHRVIYHEVDCMGCRLETCIEQQKKCLTSVTVEEVLHAVTEALAQPSARK
jgi:ADP-heptose:LPS heptosyltransferase